jgi:hypothetical protein
MIEAIHPSKVLILTRAAWPHIPEDSILHTSGCSIGERQQEHAGDSVPPTGAELNNGGAIVILPFMSLHSIMLQVQEKLYL